jgi:hypothetical protein
MTLCGDARWPCRVGFVTYYNSRIFALFGLAVRVALARPLATN